MDAEAVQREWLTRSGEFSPQYYAYYGPNETSERLRAVFDARLGPDPAVLELGSSAGRHLSHLHDHGYRDLTGVEINAAALDVMRDAYPDLAAEGTFHFDAIEDIITGFDDDQFDAVYSVETLQHIHPDHGWVFEEVARITAGVLVTVEVEGDAASGPSTVPTVNYVDDAVPLYYRDWREVFTRLGLTQVESTALGRDTLRVFGPPSA
jgi:SAM-dependent methyltransferase